MESTRDDLVALCDFVALLLDLYAARCVAS
ncbi:MAG: hypothetical protein JWL72_4216 [Ilumatobacteraceae bacterium]|nr:hypothetical protein [Ilumatobacteraceae bacterium]MCU1390878.1 hypothetical protein [Ilumatobacteraceae bacterium]